MNENILEFPKSKIVRENMNNQVIAEKMLQGTKSFADAFSAEIEDFLLREMIETGINIHEESFLKDFHITMSLLKATVYRSFDIEHELHKFMDESIVVYPKDVDTEA